MRGIVQGGERREAGAQDQEDAQQDGGEAGDEERRALPGQGGDR